MKLKDKNNVIEELLNNSLNELSEVFTKNKQKELGEGNKAFFSFWTRSNFLDKDKNICVRGVLDFGVVNTDNKVISFKKLLDRALVLRENTGTLERPKYSKQLGYEELRRKILHEVSGKSFASLVLGLVEQTAEQIEEFNKQVPENVGDEV